MKRILIADDHEIVRRGLRQILADEFPKIQVGDAANARDTVEAVRKQAWDAVLLDINMPGRSGLEVLGELKQLRPGMPVVVLTAFPEEDYAVRAFKLGASAYVSKQSASDELLAALRKALTGGRYVTRRRSPRSSPPESPVTRHPRRTRRCPIASCRCSSASRRAARSRKLPPNSRSARRPSAPTARASRRR